MSSMGAVVRAIGRRATESEPRAACAHLGPARVTRVVAGDVEVELSDGAAVRARLALAYPYQPAAGDVLLVIGDAGAHYVIGVLEGRGQTVLSFQGGMELRAIGGPLSLVSDSAVRVEAPEVAIDAGALRMAAGAVVQKFTSLYQRVSALLSVRARDAETVIDDTQLTRAKSASILTEETMSINGKQIHLG